ncbi:MAG: App1 family protein [Flavisolibacter sp.]
MPANELAKTKLTWPTWFFKKLGLTNKITIKAYHGYAYGKKVILHGHVFKLSPVSRKKYNHSVVRNTLALLRLFMVEPYGRVRVEAQLHQCTHEVLTAQDGFFKLEWQEQFPLPHGWVEVKLRAWKNQNIIAEGIGSVYVPYPTQYGFISDIDDTFLVSYSSKLRKRLYVLLTQNARSRKPFDGVVRHYQLLAGANSTGSTTNPFFYVSSSEWNLYDYIREFTIVNHIPEGVFLLNQLKLFRQLLKTGQGNHKTKFTRISRILEHYPEQKFVLLGDSSQQDPYIYQAIVEYFPKQIHAVYIRDVYLRNKQKVSEVIGKIETLGVSCCFFQHSSEAIAHSLKIGLVQKSQLE